MDNKKTDSGLASLPLAAEKYHGATAEDIVRVQSLTGILTRGLARAYPELLSSSLATRIVLYSPLHDVGKILIPEMIIKKQGPLSDEEFAIMKTHTTKGAEYLKKSKIFGDEDDLKVAAQIAQFHHEKYDGSGYPNGLKGEQIPIAARIMAVVDIYDALRSDRSYKNAVSHEQAMHIILNGDERTLPAHLDPKVLEVFKGSEAEIKELYGA